MNTWKNARLWLAGLALGTMAALLIAPQTRWMVHDQTIGLLQNKKEPVMTLPVAEAIAAHHPNDLQLQIAAAVAQPVVPASDQTNEGRDAQAVARWNRLHSLAGRFPDSPSLYAACLRNAPFVRLTPRLHFPGDIEPKPAVPDRFPSPAELAAYDADAAAGERLDPSNAYFPFARTVGLYLAHRDSEALAALHRAGALRHYDEYVPDEVRGNLRLSEENGTGNSSLSRMSIMYSTLFPQYTVLRSSARAAMETAIQREKSGHPLEGWAIRQDILHCGSVMRTDSPFLIGSLVGMALTGLAAAPPGVSTANQAKEDGEHVRERQLAAFCAYLDQNGLAKYVPSVKSEAEANKQVHSILQSDVLTKSMTPTTSLIQWWAVDIVLFLSAVWLLLFGGVALLLSKTSRIRAGEPMPLATTWGIAGGISAAHIMLLCITVLHAPVSSQTEAFFGSAFHGLGNLGFLVPIGVILSALAAWRKNFRHGILVLTLTFAASFVVGLLVIRGADGIATTSVFTMWVTLSQNDPLASMKVTLLAGFGSLLLSCLVLIASVIVSRIRRIPVSVGITRAFQHASVPLACLVVLVYSGMVFGTLRQERQVQYGIEQNLQHEGGYLAQLAGKTWPGPTNWDPNPSAKDHL